MKNLFLSPLICVLAFTISSCLNPGAAKNKAEIIKGMSITIAKSYPDVPMLTIEDYQTRKEAILVDVRSPAEIKMSRIPNAIPRSEFEELFHNDKEALKGKLIVTYCTIGKRGSEYAREIINKGLRAANLQEAILGWSQRQLPLVDSENKPTKKVFVVSEAWNLVPDNYQAIWD